MGIITNIIHRRSDKRYEVINDLSEEMVDLIADNVNTINRYHNNANLMVNTGDFHKQPRHLIDEGWKEEPGLHDSLVNEFNSTNDKGILLKRWVRG